MIPKHCIKKFKEIYTYYPSILELVPSSKKEEINKFFSKGRTIWRKELTDSENITKELEKLIDYDSTGIMVYIKEESHIFILTTENKMDVAKFTLTRLKKILN